MITAQELLWRASRAALMDNTSKEEVIGFMEEQIRDPYNSDDSNYMKKLSKMVSGPDELDEICKELFIKMQDVYTCMRIDVSDYDQHYGSLCAALYKFFVKNASKLMYLFIREFLYNNRNRKTLVDEFSNLKLPNYPKEQYGKKEYYILITKLVPIVDEIFEGSQIDLSTFIEYLSHSDSAPVYLDEIQDALDNEILFDKGVVSEMYKLYRASDNFRMDMNRLEMDITNTFIIPYLQENGLMSVRLPPVEEIPEETEDDEEDEEDDDTTTQAAS